MILNSIILAATAVVNSNEASSLVDFEHILAALIYSVMGIVVFIIIFALIDWISPKDLWGEIADKQNVAMAVLAGFVALGITIIIAASITG